jgi:alpha-D-ribose 1-methylphosphonate 5-triphosphate synthase subunit PhnG
MNALTENLSAAVAPDIAIRQAWLAALAHAPRKALAALAPPALQNHRFEWLRAPETGLSMLRARIGNTGDRFNMGEATVTRCAARFIPDNASAKSITVGVGYVLGRDEERAEWVAKLDALLQQADLHDELMASVIEPLKAARAAQLEHERAQTAASRVNFFTLQRENV